MNTAASQETVHELFNRAFALHRNNQWDAAKSLYEEVLVRDPQHAHAIHSLGVIASAEGRYMDAIQMFKHAIALNGNENIFYDNLAETHLRCGNCLKNQKRPDEALKSYDEALRLKPDLAEAHLNRANALFDLMRPDDALASCQRALSIKPEFAEAHLNYGVFLVALKRPMDALRSYDRTLAIKPSLAHAHFNRSTLLRDLGRPEEALESCNQALVLKPDYVEAHLNRAALLETLERPEEALASSDLALKFGPTFAEAHLNRGVLLQRLNRPGEALASIETALIIKPRFALAHFNRGSVLHELYRLDDSLGSYDHAIALKADYAEAYTNRGNVLAELDQLNVAMASHNQAIVLKTDFAEAYSNRGLVLTRLRQVDAALASFDQAVAIKADLATARFNRSVVLLLAGDFHNGWHEYEWRWKTERGLSTKRERLSAPAWLGQESIENKVLLLCGEQGLGDTIQFCRYAKLLAHLGATVILEVLEPLKGLLGSLEGVAQCIAHGETRPAFDYHCSLMSLPLALGTTLASIPAPIPYLRSDAGKVRFWEQMLGRKTSMRVGLVWSGGFRLNQPEVWSANRRRNIPLAKFAPLKSPGIEFYSLQKGEAAKSELAELVSKQWDGPQVKDFTSLLADFVDTAALIQNLDLVISVDTSIAHLAGALGKPVWILNCFDACWRWLLVRTDSPWYPTAKLYRQETAGDWDGVVRKVAADLQRLNDHRS